MLLSSSSSSSISSTSTRNKQNLTEALLVNRMNNRAASPICIAASKLDVPMLLLLLKHGANPSIGKWQGRSALAAVAKKVQACDHTEGCSRVTIFAGWRRCCRRVAGGSSVRVRYSERKLVGGGRMRGG
jgi:hypothetical protein